MDYQIIQTALQAKAEAETHKTRVLVEKHPRKYANIKDKGEFWRSLAAQLEKWTECPDDRMPFSTKQVFFVSKAFNGQASAFWAFWDRERHARGIVDNHKSGCKAVQGLSIDGFGYVHCRDCGAELGKHIPDAIADPVFKATLEIPDTLDLDGEIEFEHVEVTV